MAESSGTSSLSCDTGQSQNQILIETATQLTDKLRDGCVCQIKNSTGERSVNERTQNFGTFINNVLDALESVDMPEINTDGLLIILTFLRTLAKCTLYPISTNDHGEKRELYCKSLWEWQVVVQRVKFKITSSIINVWRKAVKDNEPHLKNEAENTFANILFMVPCPVENVEDCHKTCQKIMQNFIQLKYNSNTDITPSFVLRLLYIMYCEIEDESEFKRQKRCTRSNFNRCITAKVFIKVSIKKSLDWGCPITRNNCNRLHLSIFNVFIFVILLHLEGRFYPLSKPKAIYNYGAATTMAEYLGEAFYRM